MHVMPVTKPNVMQGMFVVVFISIILPRYKEKDSRSVLDI